MRRLDEIIIHCSATPEGKDFTVEDIRKWHKQRGFNDIGYHYVIYRDGSIHQGRPIDQVGAHCSGKNATTIGICYIGGCTADGKTAKDTRTDAQKAMMAELVRSLKLVFGICRISGHYQYAAKACPSFDVQNWLREERL